MSSINCSRTSKKLPLPAFKHSIIIEGLRLDIVFRINTVKSARDEYDKADDTRATSSARSSFGSSDVHSMNTEEL